MLWVIIFVMIYRQRQADVICNIIHKKDNKERLPMKALAEKFIGKDCLIYTFNGSQIPGTVKEVTDGAVLLDNGKNTEAVNMDYIVRIREYPKNKNGKKKSVVLD